MTSQEITCAENLPTLAIMGPTGTGKTDLAVALVERFPYEIISVDSALVYREMNIGTAKPDADTLKRAPHRLIDMISPEDVYSAARFREDVIREMDAIRATRRVPLLVGGTGLYFRALFDGLSDLPSADPVIRAEIEAEAAEAGWEAMHAKLEKCDPTAAARIHPNDPQRIERALEVYRISGRSLTEHLHAREKYTDAQTIQRVILQPADRQWLRDRLAVRFDQMLASGLIEECEGLRDRHALTAESPSMRLVGYRQVWQYLEGELDHSTMRERAIIATRQLAKRQMTWFRSDQDACRVYVDRAEPFKEILQTVNKGQLFLS